MLARFIKTNTITLFSVKANPLAVFAKIANFFGDKEVLISHKQDDDIIACEIDDGQGYIRAVIEPDTDELCHITFESNFASEEELMGLIPSEEPEGSSLF